MNSSRIKPALLGVLGVILLGLGLGLILWRSPTPPPLPPPPAEQVRHTSLLEPVKKAIFEEHAHLKQFDDHHSNAMPHSNPGRDYEAMLADPQMLAKAKQGLLFPPEKSEELKGTLKRLIEIDYLRAALHWARNPQREQVVATIEEIILTDNFRSEQEEDLRVSLAANKSELFELLHDHDAQRAQALIEKAKGGRLEALIGHFAERNQQRLAREQALSLPRAGSRVLTTEL